MKLRIILLIFIATHLGSMEPQPRKRGAQEAIEQESQKTQRIQQEIIYPLASLPGLPTELQITLAEYLLNAPGANNDFKLLNAATNIRNLFILNKWYKEELLDDVDLTGKIIKALAQRYTNNDLVNAAITFNTNAASLWLAQQIQQELVASDGSIKLIQTLKGDELKLYNDLQQALDFAVNNNRLDILRFLLAYQPRLANWQVNSIKDNVEERLSLLEVALYRENADMVRILLKAGAKITDAIVTSAAANDTAFALQQLQAAGVDLKANYDGESLFHFANNEQVIAYLVAQGADINAENNNGVTALQEALYEDRSPLATLLLKYGADPNIQNELGDTALHSAIIKGAPIAIIRSILNKITDPEVANADGNTPLALAILGYDLASIELLLSRGVQLPPVIYESGAQGNVVAVSPLAFVLRMAAETDPRELIKIVELLLSHGANPNEMITDPNTGTQTTLLSRMQNDRLSWTPVFRNIMAMLKAYGGHE